MLSDRSIRFGVAGLTRIHPAGLIQLKSLRLQLLGCFTFMVAGVSIADAQTTRGTRLEPFLSRHCFECHSGDQPEGGFNLHTISVTFADAEVRRRWVYLYDRVANGEMPPESDSMPDDESRIEFLSNLGDSLARADRAGREFVLRRLNRNEYENTVRDLFDIYVDVKRLLPDDSVEQGFDTTGSALSLSAEQMVLYIEAADLVLDQAFGPPRKPKTIHKTVNFATTRRGAGSSERKLSDGVVLFSSAKHLPLYDASLPMPGLYRVRVKVRAEQSQSPVVMHVKGGNTGAIAAHTVGFLKRRRDGLRPWNSQTVLRSVLIASDSA